jgi:2,4-dienoyl-CoA reductase-like NADH-dependent reductase (Old Yellow Enzyme family)
MAAQQHQCRGLVEPRPRQQADLIVDFEQAEAIIGTGDADMIALTRGILYDPRWPWHAAAHFGARVEAPK